MCQESNQKKFKVTKRIVKFPLFKRKRSIDLLYNNLNILNITELYLELVRCMFIYIDFYHNAKTLNIFSRNLLTQVTGMSNSGSSLRLQGVIYLHTFGFLSLIHSICLAPCSVSFSLPSLLTIFFSVHWSYFLLLHMDFFMHRVGSEERLQITQILSHFRRATL